MDRWLSENGKPALLEALSEAWGRVEENFQDAYHSEAVNQARLRAEVQVLKNQIINADRLEKQNKDLREELAQLKKSNQRQLSPQKAQPRTPLTSLDINEVQGLRRSAKGDHLDISNLRHPDLVTEYSDLEGRYNKLRKQYTNSVDANLKLQSQCREKTKAYENWMEHADKLQGQVDKRNKKIERLKAQLADAPHNDAAAASSFTSDANSFAGDDREIPEQRPRSTPRRPTSASTTLWPPEIERNASRDSSVLGGAVTEATERAPSLPPLPEPCVEPSHNSPAKEASSDAPVVISERAVRKRRRADEQLIQVPAATRIKTEDGSDPIITDQQYRFLPHESIDFDNAEERVSTPRKTRENRSITNITRSTVARNHALDPMIDPSSMSAHVQERDQAAKQDRADDRLHADVLREEQMEEAIQALDYGEPTRSTSRSSVLHLLESTPLPKLIARTPKCEAIVPSSLRLGIASLAEDGDDDTPASRPRGRRSVKTGRLETLLNTASPAREAITLSASLRAENVPASPALHIPKPQKSDLPFGKQGQRKVSKVLRAPDTPSLSNHQRTSTATKPKKRALDAPERDKAKNDTIPLRNRPQSSLNRGDFKINPRSNDGVSYAFTEVVRNKDERAGLSGCTKEACCGKVLRPLVEAERTKTGVVAIRSFLETYLGDDAWKLAGMRDEEREKMWLEAKTQEFANKFGKHRHRYDRMASPPGYWRQDFPSTQEDLEDRQEASRMELADIEDRYKEALKKGKWLFRDEEP
ncbi:DNA repair protein endonuclease SAE2/CtIP C-terminus-domain-containing protein [Xylariales sp. AK1849]|nr:DNA repair protein endonuclease SAE2/CtIP C-terminus-domain-containing protein [Xylariales sp. AK1849]